MELGELELEITRKITETTENAKNIKEVAALLQQFVSEAHETKINPRVSCGLLLGCAAATCLASFGVSEKAKDEFQKLTAEQWRGVVEEYKKLEGEDGDN